MFFFSILRWNSLVQMKSLALAPPGHENSHGSFRWKKRFASGNRFLGEVAATTAAAAAVAPQRAQRRGKKEAKKSSCVRASANRGRLYQSKSRSEDGTGAKAAKAFGPSLGEKKIKTRKDARPTPSRALICCCCFAAPAVAPIALSAGSAHRCDPPGRAEALDRAGSRSSRRRC